MLVALPQMRSSEPGALRLMLAMRGQETVSQKQKKAIIIDQFKCACGKLVPVYFDRAALEHRLKLIGKAEKAIREGKFDKEEKTVTVRKPC